MKHSLCFVLLAIQPFGTVLADAPQSKNAKITLVYQHELSIVPGKSVSANASETKPVKILAAFEVDKNETQLPMSVAKWS